MFNKRSTIASESEKVSSKCNASARDILEKSRPVSGHTHAFKAVATRLRPDLVTVINFFKFQGGEQEEDQDHGEPEMYPGEAAWDAFAKEYLGPRVIGGYVKDGDRFRMVQRVWGS